MLSESELKAHTEQFRERFQKGESLEDLLPEAFATVKNASRRLMGSKSLVMGIELPWEMVHYDVQLIGGMALHQGRIGEMATGEGKTLVSTLPLYLNALSGRNVQLVTVNVLASAACKASADTGCGNSGLGVHLCPRRPGHHPGTHGRHLANLPHVSVRTAAPQIRRSGAEKTIGG